MINFTRAFDSAWERTNVILFRPFDFGKWCVIGFSAFLAGLLQGGNGFNGSANYQQNFNPSNTHFQAQTHNVDIHGALAKFFNVFTLLTTGAVVAIIVGVFLLLTFFALLMVWLGARGQFMLLDNIVRNRGAIAWPWQVYARQANSYCLLYLLFVFLSLILILPFIAIAVILCVPLYQQHRWPTTGETAGFIGLGVGYFVVAIVMSVFLFLFREFCIPIMFRRGLMARAALGEMIGVVSRHAGSVAIFILLRFALAIALVIVSVILCCVTCCIYVIPYVGTLFLLPAILYLRCFTLDCLAQFGPEYDVFTVDVPPPVAGGWSLPGGDAPLSPPPPL